MQRKKPNQKLITFQTSEGEKIKEDNAVRILGFLKNNIDSFKPSQWKNHQNIG